MASFSLDTSFVLRILTESLTAESPVTITPSARLVFDLPNLSQMKPGFFDRLIHGAARAEEQTLVTFEKAAKKLPGALVIAAT